MGANRISTAAPSISTEDLNREADARFWAQTGYKPQQKLDPKNPTDRAWEPVWRKIFRDLQADARAGRFVRTYDHPGVVQDISDAAIASQAAAAHATAAATAPDASQAQANVAAATAASQVSAQKALDAAARQPPTVDPQLVKKAGQAVASSPPPAQASADEHLAHEHTRWHAHDHAQAVHAQAGSPLAVLYKETNARFWNQEHYKPGQNLDLRIAEDREKAKVWMRIFHEVQAQADAGTLVLTSPELVPPAAPPIGPPMLPPGVPPGVPTPPVVSPSAIPSTGPVPPSPYPWPPVAPWAHHPHHPRVPHHGGSHLPSGSAVPPPSPAAPSSPDTQAPPAPQVPVPVPPSGGPGSDMSSPGMPAPGVPGGPTELPPPEEKSTGVGTYIAVGFAVVLGGGLLYYATTRRPTRPPPRARSRATRMPMSRPPAPPARAVRGLLPAPVLEAEELDE